MEIKIKMKSPADEAAEKKQRSKAAQSRKQQATESMEDAWLRISQMNLTDSDKAKLREVHAAFEAGELGRDPADSVSKTGAAKKFSKAEALRLWFVLNERNRAQKIQDMIDNIPDNYELIQTKEHLADFLRDLMKEPISAIDTETTGLDVYDDQIVGISLTCPLADRHCYIPIGHETDEPQLELDFVLWRMKDYLLSRDHRKVLHNAKFDIHMLIRHGVRMRGLYWDTQVAHSLLNENEVSNRLKDLATSYLGEPSDTYGTLFGKIGFHQVSCMKTALAYAAKDTHITYKLHLFQLYHMNRLGDGLVELYAEVENPLIDVVVDMEREGFVMDLENAKIFGAELSEQIADLEAQLITHFGEGVNFNSPAQLSAIVFDELRLDRHLPSGMKKSTDKKVMKILAEHHEGIAVLLEFKKLSKLYGTYIDTLPKKIKSDPAFPEKGARLHGAFNQDKTATGRFSSSDPNLQNQPANARKIFKAPSGKILLSGDFSQQEPRLLTHFSQEPLLLEAYRSGRDLYTYAAAELWGMPVEECGDGSKWRKMMKTGILAVMYGTGAKTLGSQLDIPQKEAQEFIDAFYAKYTYVKKWVEDSLKYARKHGYARMLNGRKRRVPDINSKDKWRRLRAERQALNSIIQGSAAIMTKIAMIKVDELCKRKGWQLVLTVHDEIGAYAPDTITPEDVAEFENCMLTAIEISVPSKSDLEAARIWGGGVAWLREEKLWAVVEEVNRVPVIKFKARTPKEALDEKERMAA